MDPQLESRPAFLFFKGAANGLFAEGADRLSKGVNDQQALLIGIKCERGSHHFFKKYGERFEDSEGKQIFMEFAEEEKQHLELLIREYKSLTSRKGRRPTGEDGAPRVSTASVIDLHLHTTASDGLCEPAVLVDLAWRAGIRTMSVTDHDTVAALSDAERAATASGIAFVPGIEITAVHDGRDVHVLGYFIEREDTALAEFLEQQRADRVRRIGAMADRLAEIGKPVDRDALLARRPGGWSLGRPLVAQALVKAGHVVDTRQAFDQLIGEGKPAFVPRWGRPPADVIGIINRAGGIASLAHPGLLKRDELIPGMIEAGLTAVEAFHSEHDAATTEHYLAFADRHGILVSGGSDYHGEKERRRAAFGTVGLPPERFERLKARASTREI